MPWHTLLVLGGIGSGHTGYAESLLTSAGDDPGPDGDPTTPGTPRRLVAEPTADLTALAAALATAAPQETLLVEDLTGWVGEPDPDAVSRLCDAVSGCPARVVLVSGEAGWWPVAADAVESRRAEAVGTVNRALAGAADAVVLVVAGQPSWLKRGVAGPPAAAAPLASAAAATVPAATVPAAAVPAAAAPAVIAAPVAAPAGGEDTGSGLDLSRLPSPDDAARTAANQALTRLGTVSLGALAELVETTAGWQATASPRPWQQVRVVALSTTDDPAAATRLRAGQTPLAQLAGAAGAAVTLVETAPAEPLAEAAAMAEPQVEPALRRGWRLAEQAADEGVDLLILAPLTDHAAAAAAVTTMLLPGTEPAGLLGRVRTDQGRIDDQEWIARCAAARDAVRRARAADRGGGRLLLAELGGPLLATAAGLLLGAAARRTPVLIDGPVGVAAALVARNLAAPARRWWLVPDTGGHPLLRQAAKQLNQRPVLDLRLDLGEGATSLAALPLWRHALVLAQSLSAAAVS